MKKILFTLTVMFLMASSMQVKAQDEKQKERDEIQLKLDKKIRDLNDKKQSEEIIIRKKGDKDIKINIEINGDKVNINGKPLSDFKDDNITINKRELNEYFPIGTLQYVVQQPLFLCEVAGQYDIKVNLDGGGLTGQAEALRLGISRALLKISADYRPKLKLEETLRRSLILSS